MAGIAVGVALQIVLVVGAHAEIVEVHELRTARAVEQFLDLPEELQAFVCLPVNRPYLELALKLSDMSKDKLRSVAEDLLDITL